MSRVVVVGADLSGLVAARSLAELGHEVQLFERRATVGGRVRSREVDGFTLDRGFQVLFTAYPAARRELDYDSLDLRRFPPGAIVARPGQRSTLTDPLRDRSAVLDTVTNPVARLGDLLRLYGLQRDLRRRDPDSIFPGPNRTIRDVLTERGLSTGFVESFIAPFYGGITLDRSLSTAAAVFTYTFKMLSEGVAALPATGMGAIPEQLAARARAEGVEIETAAEVTAVEAAENAVTIELSGETVPAEAAVVAADPPRARELTGVESIPTDARGCVTQYYTLPASVSLDTGGRLLLNAGGDEPNHVAPLSTVAPEYAPDDQQLLAAVFLGQRNDSGEALAQRTNEALGAWYPNRSFQDLHPLAVDRIPFAQFDQPPGLHGTLPDPTAPDGPVFLAGDYTRWSSIQGAMRSGREAAFALHAARR